MPTFKQGHDGHWYLVFTDAIAREQWERADPRNEYQHCPICSFGNYDNAYQLPIGDGSDAMGLMI